jgi:hypothetical protein
MSDLEKLARAIRRDYPSAEISLDVPMGSQHPTWLDVEYQGRSVTVEWRPGTGFGVSLLPETSSNPTAGLFQGPDEVFEDWTRAKDYVFGLLETTMPPKARVKQLAGG